MAFLPDQIHAIDGDRVRLADAFLVPRPLHEGRPTGCFDFRVIIVAKDKGALATTVIGLHRPSARESSNVIRRRPHRQPAMKEFMLPVPIRHRSALFRGAMALLGWIAFLVASFVTSPVLAQSNPSPLPASVATPMQGTEIGGADTRAAEANPLPTPRRRNRALATLIAFVLALLFLFVVAWNGSLRAQVESRATQIAQAAAEKDRLAQSVAEREQRSRVAVGQMPAILWSTDRDLVMTSAAGLGLPALGLDPDKMVGTPLTSVLEGLGLSGSPVLDRLKAGLQGEHSDLDVQILGRDYEVHIEPLRDASGRVSGLVGLTLDVAERVGAASALRDSEERYRAFVGLSSEGIRRWAFREPWPRDKSVDERLEHFLNHAYVAECNDAMAQLYDLSKADEMVGLNYAQVRKLRAAPSPLEHTRDFIASGCQSKEWVSHWVDRHGVTRWSANTAVGIFEGGVLVHTWSTQKDITQQKQAEENLRHALSLVRATLESTADGILVDDARGKIVDVNTQFADMWRIPAPMLLPENRNTIAIANVCVEQLQDPTDFLPRINRILSQPESESYDVLRLKDARVFERYSRPQHLGEETVGRVWSFRDITERERSLLEIQEANRLLEVKNAELERFTYTVSHDLKSPLITIRGYLGHLETSAAQGNFDRFREDAARIGRAAGKMEDLLRDLLELSRIGRVLKPDEDVPMSAVAQDAADLVRGPLLERGVRLEIEAEQPMVRGDRQRLVEVVQNLIENAVKFMGAQAEPRIQIGARPERPWPAFYVKDNGIGIDARHTDKVFELFEKLNPGTSGTGVGLALVKRIVEAHGGRVWVESEGAGKGTTFCFTVPPLP